MAFESLPLYKNYVPKENKTEVIKSEKINKKYSKDSNNNLILDSQIFGKNNTISEKKLPTPKFFFTTDRDGKV